MHPTPRPCPDCAAEPLAGVSRRDFIRTVAATAAATAVPGVVLADGPKPSSRPPETAVKALFDSLTDVQKKAVCFSWDHQDKDRGLLRTHISNNWQITKPQIRSNFYTREQQIIAHDIFRGIVSPEWYPRFLKQLKDDTGGKQWGEQQSLAIFGTPGSGKFELVLTGRHMTLRADGDSEPHVAFGGPIFYGHAVQGTEKQGHPGNVFWEQGRKANFVYQILDGKQQKRALVEHRPAESAVEFRGPDGIFPGLPIGDMSPDQKAEMQRVLMAMLEPYRREDRDEALDCLRKQGGLDKCSLAFYQDGDIGKDGEWDNWRIEGPSFVWYFRGEPHVHVWVNVADNPSVALNAKG